jgi:uncharacterized lipoprotein YddW (UPF0748 family)
MRNIVCTFLLFAVIYQPSFIFAVEPDEEFRAVWLTTFAGLDWPGSFDPEEQKRSLRAIVDRLHAAHFNAIIFQARSRGDAFYQSTFEPWARELTGVIGKDPGWDPLAFLIEEAHGRGMEVHAWFNVYKVWGGTPIPYDSNPPHVLATNPAWARLYGNEWWLDPGEPGVHAFLMKVALDIVERYPVDGIHFDHIRYPGRDFDDTYSFLRFGDGQDIHSWRRANITNFVREFYKYAAVIRPDLKVGSAPIGIYRSLPGFYGSTAFIDYYQDPEQWFREGIHDYIVPQVYWNVAQDPKFDIIMHDWSKRAHGRHIYGGIGLFRPEIYNEVYLQVSITRALGIPGQVYFRYNHLGDRAQLDRIYSKPALLPRMPWKGARRDLLNNRMIKVETSVMPDWIPAHLRFAIEENNRYKQLFNGINGTYFPQRYIIYRSDNYPINTNNPEHLLAVLPATTASFTNEILNPESSDFHYLLTVLSGDDEGSVDGIDETARILNREILLPLQADPYDRDLFHLMFYMPRGASTFVHIVDDLTGTQYPVIRGFLDAGFHALPLHRSYTQPFTRCIIQVGDRVTERLIRRYD